MLFKTVAHAEVVPPVLRPPIARMDPDDALSEDESPTSPSADTEKPSNLTITPPRTPPQRVADVAAVAEMRAVFDQVVTRMESGALDVADASPVLSAAKATLELCEPTATGARGQRTRAGVFSKGGPQLLAEHAADGRTKRPRNGATLPRKKRPRSDQHATLDAIKDFADMPLS